MGKSYNKISLKFDECKRKDFLTGFHKRKEARKKHARQQMDKQLKEKKIEIKQDKRKQISQRLEEIKEIKLKNNHELVGYGEEMKETTTINLTNHQVTVVETDMMSPFETLYMGCNTDKVADSDNKSETVQTKPSIRKNIEKLEKKKQRLVTKRNKFVSSKASKQTRKFLRRAKRQKGRNK